MSGNDVRDRLATHIGYSLEYRAAYAKWLRNAIWRGSEPLTEIERVALLEHGCECGGAWSNASARYDLKDQRRLLVRRMPPTRRWYLPAMVCDRCAAARFPLPPDCLPLGLEGATLPWEHYLPVLLKRLHRQDAIIVI